MKKIFVFMYGDMRIGGIQKSMYEYAKHYVTQGVSVIWVVSRKTDIYEGFRETINSQTITICNLEKLSDRIKDITNGEHARIILFSFGIGTFLTLQKVEMEFSTYEVWNYLCISNYQGKNFFVEENFRGRKQQSTYELFKTAYTSIWEHGQLLFYSKKQADVFQTHYSIGDLPLRLVPSISMPSMVDDNQILARYKTKTILTVGRFDFPHKGYILGLIDVFNTLAKHYSDYRLIIIGYGAGENIVRSKINSLDVDVQKRVELIPGVPPEQLIDYFNVSTVFVGLAGAVTNAASCGLVSLTARHFCEDCESYGLYADHPEKNISDDPGKPVADFILKVMNMDIEEYVSESKRTRITYENVISQYIKDITECYPVNDSVCFSDSQTRNIRACCKRYTRLNRLKQIIAYLKSPSHTIKRLKNRFSRVD